MPLKSVLFKILALVWGTLQIGLIFLLLIFSLPLFILRLFLGKFFSLKFVTPQGNILTSDLFSSKPPRCTLILNCVVDGYISVQKLERMFHENMVLARDKITQKLLYPEFQQYVSKFCGFSYWVDDPYFDIKNHVKGHPINSGFDNKTVTPDDLTAILEDLLNKKFASTQSPWEIYVINNYKENYSEQLKTVVATRFHHSLADGYAALYSMILAALKIRLSALDLPKFGKVNKQSRTRRFFNFLWFPFKLYYELSQGLFQQFQIHPWKIPDAKKTWHQFYATSAPVEIRKIKEIKNKLNINFASVVLSAISTAMSKVTVSDSRSVPFCVPLPVANHPNALENHFTATFINVPATTKSDSVKRLFKCDAIFQKQKTSTLPGLFFVMTQIIGFLPSSLCCSVAKNRVFVALWTGFSCGNKTLEAPVGIDNDIRSLESIVQIVRGTSGTAGVCFSSMTYGQYIRFAVTAEAAVMTKGEINTLLQILVDEINSLHEETENFKMLPVSDPTPFLSDTV